MIPLTTIRNQSGALSWVSPDDLAEWAYRAKLLERAKLGNEDATAELRDGYRIRTLLLSGTRLIDDGVLVGAAITHRPGADGRSRQAQTRAHNPVPASMPAAPPGPL